MTTTNPESAQSPPPRLGALLVKLDRLINERYEQAIGVHGFSRRQWQLFNLLAEGAAPIEALDSGLAPFLDQDAGETARRHLDPLLDEGLVRDADGVYALTDAGRDRFRALAGAVESVRAQTTAGLEAGEYLAVVTGLDKMVRNLEGGR